MKNKKIVLFSDGTGNSASSAHKTNIWRTYKALDKSLTCNQFAFYDDGVGTSSFNIKAILGKVFGYGLKRNVMQLYKFVCQTYTEDCEIYAFGFSRGAFTIRVLIALIADQGIVDVNKASGAKDLDRKIKYAYRAFRFNSFHSSFLSALFRPIRDCIVKWFDHLLGRAEYHKEDNLWHDPEEKQEIIKFVGVWDTVSAYGGPVDELTMAWDQIVWPFIAKDLRLSKRVARACHALSIDEQRKSFSPLLWKEEACNGTHIDQERISQVWFSGVHANVGGGYPDDSIALISLNWMLDQSEKNNGLVFLKSERARLRDEENILGPIYNNRKGLGNLYRYAPRVLDEVYGKCTGFINRIRNREFLFSKTPKSLAIQQTPKIHHSVFDQIKNSGDGYAPINIPERYFVVLNQGEIVSRKTASKYQYTFPETKQESNERNQRQRLAWNKVRTGKMIHYFLLGAIAIFLINLLKHICQYDTPPFAFISGVGIIGILAIAGHKIGKALAGEMRINWNHVTGSGPTMLTSINGARASLAQFFESPVCTKVMKPFVSFILRAFGWLIIFGLVFAVVSRAVFIIGDGFDLFCDQTSDQTYASFGESFVFDPTNTCFNTGLELKKDQQYSIEIGIKDKLHEIKEPEIDTIDKWIDGYDEKKQERGINSDLEGFIAPPWYMMPLSPLKRHFRIPWINQCFK